MNINEIFQLSVHNYMALRQEIPGLRNRDLADMIKANALSNAKDVGKIVEMYDPPPEKR